MLNNQIKNSLYKAVSKYKHERQYLKDCRQDLGRIVAVAKGLGFEIKDQSKYGDKAFLLSYEGKGYVSFYIREDEVHASYSEYDLLTGQALIDYTEQQEAESKAEIEAERRMSLYNSGYRDF